LAADQHADQRIAAERAGHRGRYGGLFGPGRERRWAPPRRRRPSHSRRRSFPASPDRPPTRPCVVVGRQPADPMLPSMPCQGSLAIPRVTGRRRRVSVSLSPEGEGEPTSFASSPDLPLIRTALGRSSVQWHESDVVGQRVGHEDGQTRSDPPEQSRRQRLGGRVRPAAPRWIDR
jgi:hypothetical protein